MTATIRRYGQTGPAPEVLPGAEHPARPRAEQSPRERQTRRQSLARLEPHHAEMNGGDVGGSNAMSGRQLQAEHSMAGAGRQQPVHHRGDPAWVRVQDSLTRDIHAAMTYH